MMLFTGVPERGRDSGLACSCPCEQGADLLCLLLVSVLLAGTAGARVMGGGGWDSVVVALCTA